MKKIVTSLTASLLILTTNACIALTEVEQQLLTTHNQLRKQHQSPPLHWDAKLAQYAQNYAEQCQFRHSKGPYGENLATGYATPKKAVQIWYDESKLYSYQRPGFSMDTGHFTQLVWKNSTKLGCAMVSCDGKNGTPGDYVVCEYNPPGNVVAPGYFEENVLEEA